MLLNDYIKIVKCVSEIRNVEVRRQLYEVCSVGLLTAR